MRSLFNYIPLFLDILGIVSSILLRRRRDGGIGSLRIAQLKTPKILNNIFKIDHLTAILAVVGDLRNWILRHAMQVGRKNDDEDNYLVEEKN